jgi:hypothetical protein
MSNPAPIEAPSLTDPAIVPLMLDPLATSFPWVVVLAKQLWPQDAGIENVIINTRANQQDLTVGQGYHFLTFYRHGDEPHEERAGNQAEDRELTITADIRSSDRDAAWRIKEILLHSVLEPARRFPLRLLQPQPANPYEWTKWKWRPVMVADYLEFCHWTVDITMHRYKAHRSPMKGV